MSRRIAFSPWSRETKRLQKRRTRMAASLLGGWRTEAGKMASISRMEEARLDSFGREVAHDEAEHVDIFKLLGEAPDNGSELRAPARFQMRERQGKKRAGARVAERQRLEGGLLMA